MLFTAIDPVPPSLWASYHVFGLLSWGHGLCTAILTLTAAACVRTRAKPRCYPDFCELQTDSRTVTLQVESTPELYYLSLSLTLASACSTGETPSLQSDTVLGSSSNNQHLPVPVQLFLQCEEDSG